MSTTEHVTKEQARAMLGDTRRRWLPPVALLALVGGGIVLFAVGEAPKASARAAAAERAERTASAPRRVLTAVVRRADEVSVFRQPATLEPLRRAQILAQVAGYLVERRVEVGDRVQAGQVLGLIAAPLVEKELRQAESERGVAVAAAAEAEQSSELARRTAERLREALANNAASRQDVDNAETELRRTGAALERARAGVLAIDARIQRLQRELEFRELKAPFDGVVTRRTRDQGDFIEFGGNPNDPPVFTVVDPSTLRIVVQVPQAQAYQVRVGQEARVLVGGQGGTAVTARVSRLSAEIDPATRTMPIEIEVPNPDGKLIVGSYATVEIRTVRGEDQRPALIPGNALMLLPTTPDGGGGPTAAVVTPGEGASFGLSYRTVRLGRDFGSEIEVLSGLAPGERVALNLPIPLPAGAKIEPVDPPAPPAPPPAAAAPVPAPPSPPSGTPGR